MEKTAIMQAIEACKEVGEKSHYAQMCIDIMTQLLPIERQQILDSYRDGATSGSEEPYLDAAHYFTTTYKSE